MKRLIAILLLLVGMLQPRLSLGATASLVDVSELAAVKLHHPNRLVVGYGLGAADAAAVGTALANTYTAATANAGELIEVCRTATTTATIAKDGVDLNGHTGITIRLSTTSTLSTVSDDAGPMAFTISGAFTLARANNGKGAALKVTNASSNIRVFGTNIVNEKTAIGTTPDKANLEGVAIYVQHGACYVVNELNSGTIVDWWDGGDHYLRCAKLNANGSLVYSVGLYSEAPVGETGWYSVDCPDIVGASPVLLRTAGTSGGTARCWIHGSRIKATGGDVPKILVSNLFAYFSGFEKIEAGADDTTYPLGFIEVQNGAYFELETQKFATRGGGTSAGIHVKDSRALLKIWDVDDAAGMWPAGLLYSEGISTVFCEGFSAQLATAGVNAFTCAGGNLYLSGWRISTQSGQFDLVRAGGTLTVDPTVKYSAAKTFGTISYDPIYGTTPTTAGLALLGGADAAAQRTSLALGTIATQAASAVAITGGTASGITSAAFTSSGTLGWSGRTQITSPADGQLLLTNAAGNAFSMLQLGGTTSSFPAIKRNGSFVHIRKADDSGYAGLVCDTFSGQGSNISFPSLPTSDPSVTGGLYSDSGAIKMSGGANAPTYNLANCSAYPSPVVRQINISSTFNPADATTYYFGAIPGNSQAGGFQRMYVTSACTIKKVTVWLQGSSGSNESSSFYIRVNNTTDTLINSSIICNSIATPVAFSNLSMSVSLAAGDYFEPKWVTPTWVTNPTSVNGAITVELSQP